MRIEGDHTVSAPRQDVWDALMDPQVLARSLPGCRELEVVGPDRYAATIDAGVASIKGTYTGEVELADKDAPQRYTMTASGSGGPGTIQADAEVTLHDVDGGATRIEYAADAVVGGMIAGVGQRVLSGVTKRTAAEFFGNVEREILEGPAAEPEPADAADEAAAPATAGAGAPAGQRFSGARPAAATAGAPPAWQLAAAVVLGAAIAFVGVLIGRRSR